MSTKKPHGLASSVIRRLPQVEGCDTPLLKCLLGVKGSQTFRCLPGIHHS